MKYLTPKQEKFCNLYLETGNASKAYRGAYSCDKMKDTTVNRKAAELLKNGKITAEVRLMQSELKKTSDIKKEAILEELSCIAFSTIEDYVKFDGKRLEFKSFEELTEKQLRAIESIRHTKYGIEIRLHGKNWTIERICRILGFDKPEELNLQLNKLSESDLDTIIEKLLSQR